MGKYLYKHKQKYNKLHYTVICNERLYNVLNNVVFWKDKSNENSNILSSESGNM